MRRSASATRTAAVLTLVAALGVLTAFGLPQTGAAANPMLFATVNDDYTITLKDADGNDVTSLAPGTYDIDVHDNSTFHNFRLSGPGVSETTTVPGTEAETWTVTFQAGQAYQFVCDAHPLSMQGQFTVTGGTTTSSSTTSTAATTTAPATTTAAPTTTATTSASVPVIPKPSRCRVPRVVGKPLAQARRLLTQRSCRTGRVARAYSRRVRRGHVVAQNRRPGTRLARGARVDLVVSRGPSR